MKHCYFSILYNEIAFLKQKLKFIYKYFDQIILYDLNINTLEFSDDGSHEYIKSFPDPQRKITLIEKNDLFDVKEFYGYSFVNKQKMFAVGSSFVKEDMDIFWCFDMDEFFNDSLIKKAESIFNNTKYNTINVPHIIFFKSENFVFTSLKRNGEVIELPWARITRHNKGNIYGHCSLAERIRLDHAKP